MAGGPTDGVAVVVALGAERNPSDVPAASGSAVGCVDGGDQRHVSEARCRPRDSFREHGAGDADFDCVREGNGPTPVVEYPGR